MAIIAAMKIKNLPGPRERRIKLFRFALDILVDGFITGAFVEVTKGFPDGCQIQEWQVDYYNRRVNCRVEHSSFPIALQGQELEVIDIEMKAYHGAEIQVFKKFFESASKGS